MLASRSRTPSSTRVMIPAHVNVLEIDASMYWVLGSARILRSMFAQPTAVDQTICSPRTTANVAPGVPIALTFSRANASRSVVRAVAERRNENGATVAALATAARVTKSRRLRPRSCARPAGSASGGDPEAAGPPAPPRSRKSVVRGVMACAGAYAVPAPARKTP